jgi:hypothetical protein
MSYQMLIDYKTKEAHEAHVKEWGGYNHPPPGFTEITAEEFAQSGFFTWCKEGVEFRQIMSDNVDPKKLLSPIKGCLSITLFYMNHGDNYGICSDYWDKKVRYFKFAVCFHEYQEISSAEAGKPAFNCYHYCKCSKCGHQWEYDSSG